MTFDFAHNTSPAVHPQRDEKEIYFCPICNFSEGSPVDIAGNQIEGKIKPGQKGYLGGIEYTFFEGFGWLSNDELLDLRQTDPRLAP